MEDLKREIAKKAKVTDITTGEYVVKEGWEPNYIENDGKTYSRVNIIGTIVTSEGNNYVLDDGSGIIELKFFDGEEKFRVGDIVLVIGRPRKFQNKIFIAPEIIKKCDIKWLEVRKKELDIKEKNLPQPQIEENTPNEITPTQETTEEHIKEEISDIDLIINIIKETDKGDGVFIEDIISKLNNPNTEKIINSLMEQGEIFEVQPGKIKILE